MNNNNNNNNNMYPLVNFGSVGHLITSPYLPPLPPLPPLPQQSHPYPQSHPLVKMNMPGNPNHFTNGCDNYHIELRSQVNSLLNANYVLNSNITFLNQISINNYNYFNEQINSIKKEKDTIEKKLEENKRKYDEINKDTSNEYSCCSSKSTNNNKSRRHNDNDNNNDSKSKYNNHIDRDQKNSNKKIFNKYQIKKYYPNSNSWSEEKINEFLKDLKTIKDILKLKSEWYNIRHNEKLQKLSNIFPPIEKLDKMIGLEEVKKEIFKIIIYYIQNPHTDEYLHSVIIGPPGVGKTQIAKIYSEIFVRLGILQTDKFVEIKRDDLVAKYLGQTAHRTKELLESAMGGVVFLDEGYSLGNEEKRDSFAKEAIDMINQYLSERKKDFMFVVAGYEDDLEKCFFSFNRGLKRRFSHWIEISKYSKNELVNIFESKVNDCGYKLDISINKNELTNFFDKNYNKFENYAGDIEKLLNYIKYEQSFRTFRENKHNKTITLNDLKTSIEKFKEIKKYEPPIGMYC